MRKYLRRQKGRNVCDRFTGCLLHSFILLCFFRIDRESRFVVGESRYSMIILADVVLQVMKMSMQGLCVVKRKISLKIRINEKGNHLKQNIAVLKFCMFSENEIQL